MGTEQRRVLQKSLGASRYTLVQNSPSLKLIGVPWPIGSATPSTLWTGWLRKGNILGKVSLGNYIVDQEVAIFSLTLSKDIEHLLYTKYCCGHWCYRYDICSNVFFIQIILLKCLFQI